MIYHISIGTTDFQKSAVFYDAILATMGYKRCFEAEDCIGYGVNEPVFWIADEGEGVIPSLGFHVAFKAQNEQAVQDFYKTAIAHGAVENGKPGLRPEYANNYYAAYVKDLDGHHLEALCYI